MKPEEPYYETIKTGANQLLLKVDQLNNGNETITFWYGNEKDVYEVLIDGKDPSFE